MSARPQWFRFARTGLVLTLLFTALCCSFQASPPAAETVGAAEPATATATAGAAATADAATPAAAAQQGELIYVPIYSRIFHEDGRSTLNLAATLSIHNVNLDRPITILRADYYNTDGKLLKRYVPKPMVLSALKTLNIVVPQADTAGGTGANFIVEWQSTQEVNTPLVEALMVNATSNLGIAFTSTGKVIRRFEPAK